MTIDEDRESLNLRVMPDLKEKVEQYAQSCGISINAAGIMLIMAGLDRPKRRAVVRPEVPLGRFEEFYAVYPRRIARRAAERAWVAALRSVDEQTIIDGANTYADYCRREPAQFVKHPATWLNGACWDDELPVEQNGYRRVISTREPASQRAVAEVDLAFEAWQSRDQLGLPGGSA